MSGSEAGPAGPVLVLASTSPARVATLRAAGIEPVVEPSGVDEDAELARALDRYGQLAPEDVALLLARAKAEAVADRLGKGPPVGAGPDGAGDAGPDGALLLGCDSVLELDGVALGKPSGPADATQRWGAMRGRSGVLHTGHWLIDLRPAPSGTAATIGAVASTTVHFANLTDAEVEAYVATGEPLQVAGAFTLDGLGGPFVTSIEGDPHNVVGLSLPVLRDLLAEVGVSIPALWAAARPRL